jgi:hypothetical protein
MRGSRPYHLLSSGIEIEESLEWFNMKKTANVYFSIEKEPFCQEKYGDCRLWITAIRLQAGERIPDCLEKITAMEERCLLVTSAQPAYRRAGPVVRAARPPMRI